MAGTWGKQGSQIIIRHIYCFCHHHLILTETLDSLQQRQDFSLLSYQLVNSLNKMRQVSNVDSVHVQIKSYSLKPCLVSHNFWCMEITHVTNKYYTNKRNLPKHHRSYHGLNYRWGVPYLTSVSILVQNRTGSLLLTLSPITGWPKQDVARQRAHSF